MTVRLPPDLLGRFRARFERLYGSEADRCVSRLALLAGRYGVGPAGHTAGARWDQRDAVLITYGDMVQAPGEKPLATLKRFADTRLQGAFSTIHLLPFFPYSSDDGFSVIHFRTVNPDLGGWADVRALGERFKLMFDLVLNHVSRQSGWFHDYLTGTAPGRNYFIEADPKADLSAVVRPRSSPLLTPVVTRAGTRHVWTTFSADQVDLNFANPDVLFEILDILLFYVSMGARIIRLDAIAYLWKKPGTPCIHLPETHEVVKLFRDLLEAVAPDVLLLTETNVPHAENVGYFGAGDEARLVYQFPLPPLILHALRSGTARHLSGWAAALERPPAGCAFLNFSASHDGIGLRPLAGLVPDAEIGRLIEEARALGGGVSVIRGPDGGDRPYELNISWFDALGGVPEEAQFARFLCSQAIPMALAGIPAVYFNSLLAAPNDLDAVRRTGVARAVNRRKWEEGELRTLLGDPGSAAARALAALTGLLKLRGEHAAFHPDGAQRVLPGDARVFAVARTAPDGSETVAALHNCSPEAVAINEEWLRQACPGAGRWTDLVAGRPAAGAGLGPYGFAWLRAGS